MMNMQPTESKLEAVARRGRFIKDSLHPLPSIVPKCEGTSDDNESVLNELEELLRQAFFPQLTPTSPKNYRYRPFEDRNSIRLFQLKPGKREDPIEGRLVFASFDSKPKYEALSYAWGPPAMNNHILTNEGRIPITASVRSALTRLRLQNQVRILWIDALCINQKDNDEKCKQILLMPKIYSSASRAVVHLGDQSDGSDLALKLIEKIAKTSFRSFPGKFVSDSALTSIGLPHGRDEVWKHLKAFWSRLWFRRIWIIQEFLLAADVTMVCGEWEGSWEIFLEATIKIFNYQLIFLNLNHHITGQLLTAGVGLPLMCKICIQRVTADRSKYLIYRLTTSLEMDADYILSGLGAVDPELAAMETFFKSIPNIAKEFSKLRQNESFDRFAFFGVPRLRTSLRKSSKVPLLALINFLEVAEATQPRDRLFALLGLASDLDKEDLRLLQPNYKEEVKTIVCRYASVLIRKGYCMRILYQTFLQPEPHGLPSWVADWITPVNAMNKKTYVAYGEPSFYRAAGNSKPNARTGGAPESDVLIVSGGLVDTIDCVGLGPIIPRTAGAFLPMLANRALNDVDTIFETLSSYPTGESLAEVKWRTLIANKTVTGGEPPRRYGNLFLEWRDKLKGKTIALTHQAIYESVPEEYLTTLATLSNQKLCRTRGGYVGLVPTSAEAGDHICVLLGGIVPFVLRTSNERFGMYRMVGGCYVHGMMKGEALKFPHWQERSLELH